MLNFFNKDDGQKRPSKKRKTKSFTKKPNLEEIQEMQDTQGLTKGTLDKRKAVENQYNTFDKTFQYKTMDELCQEDTPKEKLEHAVCSFFDSFTSGEGDDEKLPMKNYADSTKSHLKVLIKIKTENRWDISDSVQFQQFRVRFFDQF